MARGVVKAWVALGLMLTGVASAQMSTPGSFRVSETGAAVYEIPIKVPPGVAGMEPKFSLVYNSQSGNGLLGVGWSLQGLSSITRCPRTMAQDGVRGGVNYDTNDRYCLDGQRLMAISGTYGADGTEYRTERESFTKVISYGTAGNGPSYFIAKTKAGQTIEYGNTVDSKVEAQGKSTVRVWAMSKVQDTKGNYLTTTYTEDNSNGDYRVNRVDFSGNSTASPTITPSNYIAFVYEGRSDVTQGYVARSVLKTMQRLKTIQVFSSGESIKEYRVAYGSQSGTATGRSLLASVQECKGATSECFPAMGATWSSSGLSYDQPQGGNINTWNWGSSYEKIVADLNGDGKSDVLLVHMSAGGLHIWSAVRQSNGTFSMVGGNPSTGSSEINNWHWAPSPPYQKLVGDVNGDGKTDLVLVHAGATGLYIYTLLGNGNGSFQSLLGGNPSTLAGQINGWNWAADYAYQASIADVDADGRNDVVLTLTSSYGLYIYSAKGRGDGTYDLIGGNPSSGAGQINGSNWAMSPTYQALVTDVNADGKSDIVFAATINTGLWMYTAVGRGDGTFDLVGGNSSSGTGSMAGGDWGSSEDYFFKSVADLNGDGRSDVVFVVTSTAGLHIWSAISQGDGTFLMVAGNGAGGSMLNDWNWTSNTHYRKLVGDVNGDGLSDITLVTSRSDGLLAYVAIGKGDGSFAVTGGNSSTGTGTINTWDWGGVDNYQKMIGDLNGDGKSDVILVHVSAGGLYIYGSSAVNVMPDILTGVTAGIGGSVGLTHKPLTDATVYTKDTSGSSPTLNVQAPMYVVFSSTMSNGVGGTIGTNYAYNGLKAELGTGRGLLGFKQVDATDVSTGVKVQTQYRQDWPYVGLPSQSKRIAPDGTTILSQTDFTYACTNPTSGVSCTVAAGNRYFPYASQTDETSRDLNNTFISKVRTTSTYDAMGNATQIGVTHLDAGGSSLGYSKTTTNTYTNDTTNWLLGRLIRSEVQSVAP